MIICTCMNGASSSSGSHISGNKDMSDIVQDSIQEVVDKKNYNRSSIKFFKGKGGIWKYWDKKLYEFIEFNNESYNRLIMVGKSYGGKDTVDILWDLYRKKHVSNYKRIDLLIIDADWLFRNGNNLVAPPVFSVTNFYQIRQKLGGSLISVSDSRTILAQNKIDTPNIDHFNIVENPFVKKAIDSLLITEVDDERD
jgi:hypothetical protein